MEEGYDVLITDRMGKDVFPNQGDGPVPRAMGLFFVRDKYCVVKSTIRPAWRTYTLQHEILHRFCHRFLDGHFDSRMVCEGLPEYLRFLRAGDPGLAVPPERFADDFALLAWTLKVLEIRGASLADFDPPKLLSLTAKQFYSLGHLAYLVSQAAMAYIGPAPIEEAFDVGTVKPIAEAVARIEREPFLAFVRRNAARGYADRAVVVQDGDPEEEPTASGDLDRRTVEALRELGARFEGEPRGLAADLERLSSDGPSNVLGIRAVLLALLQTARRSASGEGAPPVLLVDLLGATRGAFSLVEAPALFAPPLKRAAFEAHGTRDFIRALHRLFVVAARGGTVPIVSLGASPKLVEPSDLDTRVEFTARGLATALAGRVGPVDLIICVAGRDEALRAEIGAASGEQRLPERDTLGALAERYRAFVADSGIAIRNALVIDLGGSRGDAQPLAAGIRAATEGIGRTACWDPQRATTEVEPLPSGE